MITNAEIETELKRIKAANGGMLPPQAVVDAARLTTSILHDQFDWDDTVAAEKWRLEQARHLVRVVVAYEKVGEDKMVPHRVFVSLTTDRQKDAGYRETLDVLADPDLRRQMLLDARADMTRFRVKYQRLTELSKVFDAMDEVQLSFESVSPVEAAAV